jgi:hypothetical protein
MKQLKITNKHHEIDSMIFGIIIAGVKTRKKKLKPGMPAMETPQGMCAVGAGNRGRKVTQVSDIVTKSMQTKYGNNYSINKLHQLIPLIRFATVNNVSENYACGVNDGFENDIQAANKFYPDMDRDSLDYQRGFHVGRAVRLDQGY